MAAALARPVPLYRQICTRLEQRILAGELRVGDRLPNTADLATSFGVTVQTAHQAAALLRRRGLIERVPGRGSFVSGRILSRTIGIVCGANIFGGPRYLFFQHVYGCLCRELKHRGWHSSLYFPLEEHAPDQMLAELGQDVAADRLRGLIPLCASVALRAWLEEHPGLPLGESGPANPAAAHQCGDEAYRGVAYLLARGYRRLAVIMHTETLPPAAVAQARAGIARAYAERGLEPQASFHGGAAASHADGVAQARAVLAAGDGPPEAFYVLNDQGAAGVIFALLCHRLRIPEDVGVLAVGNKGIEIPCPVPLTRLEHDPLDFARREIEALMAVLEDREPALAPLAARLLVGQSCGESPNPSGGASA